MSQSPIIHPFGTAPQFVPHGYRLATEVMGTDAQIGDVFARSEDVVLVRGAAVFGRDGVHVIGVFVPGNQDADEKITWYVDGGPVAGRGLHQAGGRRRQVRLRSGSEL